MTEQANEKIINVNDVLDHIIRIRTQSRTVLPFAAKAFTCGILNFFKKPFLYNYYRLFGSKDTGKVYLTKAKLDFEKAKKNKDRFSYIEATKLVGRYKKDVYYPESELRKGLSKAFRSYAAHEALEMAIERAADHSDNPGIAEIPYHNRGAFGKKPAN